MGRIGRKLKRNRERRGLTQRQVARRVGCTRSAIANFENGHRGVSHEWRRAIAKALR